MEELLKPLFNFAILVGALVYFLRRALSGSLFMTDTVLLRDELQRVSKLLREARAKYEEVFPAKLKAIDAEVGEMRARFQQDAQEMQRKNRSRREEAFPRGWCPTLACSLAEQLFFRILLKGQLYSRACGPGAWSALRSLMKERLTGDDQARIRQEFSQEMESSQ